MKKIIVGKSKIDHKGIIADENIKKGDYVLTLKGPLQYLRVETKEEALSYPDWIGISKYTWIDPIVPYKYLNHSCAPTTGVRGRVRLYALRDIKKGEEITVDYSTIEASADWEMKCNCGSGNCRKIIRSVELLPYATYKKYLPYIPTYFQRLYKKSHSGA